MRKCLHVLHFHHPELFPWDKDHKTLLSPTTLPEQRISQLLVSARTKYGTMSNFCRMLVHAQRSLDQKSHRLKLFWTIFLKDYTKQPACYLNKSPSIMNPWHKMGDKSQKKFSQRCLIFFSYYWIQLKKETQKPPQFVHKRTQTCIISPNSFRRHSSTTYNEQTMHFFIKILVKDRLEKKWK